MKFSAREDIDRPIDRVYEQVTDFGGFERQILRRGADIRRIDAGQPVAVGSGWDVAFTFRGRDRKVKAVVTRLDAPTDLVIDVAANGLDGVTTVELLSLTPQRTRMTVTIDLSARTLTARLLLQSMKLAKSNLTTRFKKRVADFAVDIQKAPARGA